MKDKNKKEKIIVVDDAPDTLEMLQRNLSREGYLVFTATSVDEAVRLLKSTKFDLVITDLKMPKVSGLDLIRHVRENYKDSEIMMITGYATIEGAVEAVKVGAEEYLSKPFTDEELLSAVRKTLDRLQTRRTMKVKTTEKPSRYYGLIGESENMKKVLKAIDKAAKTKATVLITGESGTGKELVARAIHYSSNRASAAFVPINCGGIPEDLLESELFGYIKGSFTGAVESRAGFFQTAEGGSIFLDEISETSPSMQVKLLRVLQDKEIFMIGSRQPQTVDVRILAATNKDLLSLLKKDLFREDLYYRLNVINISIPSLRERGDDILLLANHFLRKFAGELDKPIPKFSDRILQVLKNYGWPGNVRELENLIQRLVVMTDGDIIDTPDLPSFLRFSVSSEQNIDRTLEEVEIEHIINVLENVNGNKTRAAKILGISRKTLNNKLNKAKNQNL